MTEKLSTLTVREMLERDASYVATIKAIDARVPDWLTVKQAAQLMERSVRQVRRYEADGLMPPRKKVGRHRKYPRGAVLELSALLANQPRGLKAVSHIGATELHETAIQDTDSHD